MQKHLHVIICTEASVNESVNLKSSGQERKSESFTDGLTCFLGILLKCHCIF